MPEFENEEEKEADTTQQNFQYSWDYIYEEEQGASDGSQDILLLGERKPMKVSMRRKLWTYMETNPSLNFFLLTVIALSTTAFCLETMHELKRYSSYFYTLEVVCVIVFSMEYVARFFTAPMPTMEFVLAPMNMIDFIAIAPFYLEFLYRLYEYSFGDTHNQQMNMTTLRVLRLARLFKFGRYSSELSLVTGAFLRSSASFLMLTFMLGIALIVFSTLMYLAEQGQWDAEMGCYVRSHFDIEGDFLEQECSPFESIPMTFWWAITTMTTVGYGDTYPVTVTGKCIAGLAMIVGILSVALPTTVLGVQFGDSYAAIQEERERLKIQHAIPSEELKHDELMKQIKHFSELREQITTIRNKVDQVAYKLVDSERADMFKEELRWFGDAVDASTSHIETLLHSVETPVTMRTRRLNTGSQPLSAKNAASPTDA